MFALARIWRRMPIVVRAIIAGTIAAAVATYPWAWLAAANLRHAPSVPWGPLVMLAYLWLYWRYARGYGWPSATSCVRRRNARWNPPRGNAWGGALGAGILGLWSCVALLRLIQRFVPTHADAAGGVGTLSPLTIVVFALTGAVVAGVVEEISFRGYMQRPIERRHGPTVAIVVVGVMFGLAHGSHSYWSLALMPYYMGVAAVYGAMAWLTDSVLPSVVLHAGGDALDALFAVASAGGASGGVSGATATLSTSSSRPIVIDVAVIVLTGAAAVWAFRELARTVREPAGFRMIAAD